MSYEFKEKLGEGAYGSVHVAIDGKRKFALKKLKMSDPVGIPFTTFREIRVLQSLKNINICELLSTSVHPDRNEVWLLMPLYHTDLLKLIKKKYKFESYQIKGLMYQIIQAVKFIHKNDIVQRDIKSGNIFIDSNGILKVGDFGISRPLNKTMTNDCTTMVYRAPELLLGCTEYDESVDNWGIGCVFYELLYRKPPFTENSEVQQIKTIIKTLGKPRVQYTWSKYIEHIKIVNENEFYQKIFDENLEIFDYEWQFIFKGLLNINREDRVPLKKLLKCFRDHKAIKEIKNETIKSFVVSKNSL